MSDDMFKAVELNRQRVEVVERDKDKKSPKDYHVRHKATLTPHCLLPKE